ncbi:uncharacterized protein LOC143468557 [Clavelina lepadiformis]|uniref:Uncharacterized protein n=1 Tax=Clavelina lepadiformis TaxID=159417 RepID=A0ABP0F3R8_CLALP
MSGRKIFSGIFLVILWSEFYIFDAAARKSSKIRYSPNVVEISSTKNCFVDTRRGNIVKLGANSYVCKHNGKYHAHTSNWFEPNRCLRCSCIAPTGVACCKVDLKPTVMPKHCRVDPFPRWSIVAPITKCMVPIVSTRSRKKPCRSRHFRNIFSNSRWQPIARHRGIYLQAVPIHSRHF